MQTESLSFDSLQLFLARSCPSTSQRTRATRRRARSRSSSRVASPSMRSHSQTRGSRPQSGSSRRITSTTWVTRALDRSVASMVAILAPCSLWRARSSTSRPLSSRTCSRLRGRTWTSRALPVTTAFPVSFPLEVCSSEISTQLSSSRTE